MKRKDKLYEGKAKIIYSTDEPGVSIMYFKDDATAFNARKKGTIKNKGIINNKVSSRLFRFVEAKGVKTHFIERLSEREMVVKSLKIIPIEVIVRNIVAGSLAKRLGMEEGSTLKSTVLEFCYKDDALDDPMINETHIRAFGFASGDEVKFMKEAALKVNEILSAFFDERGLLLVDFKLEFGRDERGAVFLADEITPDGCRLWDKITHEKLDKDRFRRDLGNVEEAYEKVLEKVMAP